MCDAPSLYATRAATLSDQPLLAAPIGWSAHELRSCEHKVFGTTKTEARADPVQDELVGPGLDREPDPVQDELGIVCDFSVGTRKAQLQFGPNASGATPSWRPRAHSSRSAQALERRRQAQRKRSSESCLQSLFGRVGRASAFP